MAAEGFRDVRCLSCHETYEIAKNPWNPNGPLPSCIVRLMGGAGGVKCGGKLEAVKLGGPKRPMIQNVPLASQEDASDLEAMLAPRGELDRRLER